MQSTQRAALRLCAFVGAFLVVGCYTLQPIRGTEPRLGGEIGLDIGDVGRVALGGSMGPEIARLEGRLIRRDTTGFLVGVTAVELLRGGEQVWHGETVYVKQEYVTSIYERRFSKSRTIVAGAVGVGAIVALTSSSILGVFSAADRPVPSDTVQAQRRPRR